MGGYLLSIKLDRESVPSLEDYPFSVPSIRSLGLLKFHPRVTYLVGENGAGKSTLLEAIAVSYGFNPEGGSRNFKFRTRDSHSELDGHVTLSKSAVRPKDGFFFRAESYFNVASEIERLDAEGFGPRVIDAYGGKSLHEQSHGESFMTLMLNRFQRQGLYLLDEPEAALSPQRQLAALSRIHDLVLADCQFIIATHSPLILAYPDSYIYLLSGERIERVEYEQTQHYSVMRDFMADRHRFLKVLMS